MSAADMLFEPTSRRHLAQLLATSFKAVHSILLDACLATAGTSASKNVHIMSRAANSKRRFAQPAYAARLYRELRAFARASSPPQFVRICVRVTTRRFAAGPRVSRILCRFGDAVFLPHRRLPEAGGRQDAPHAAGCI